MIVSHRYRFIFLKTNKTAGTSVELALAEWCGPDDIITPLAADDEQLRESLGLPGPQHHVVRHDGAKTRLQAHTPASVVAAVVGATAWDGYFKFCIERNPWDRVVSLYYWRHQWEPRPSLAEFITSGVPQVLRERGRDLYSIGGAVAVDRVCRYEHLLTDLEGVRAELGMPGPWHLPRAKAGTRTDRRPYADLYGPAERDAVAAMFSEEIASLGYRFAPAEGDGLSVPFWRHSPPGGGGE
jgi:hypothetical protein